MDMKRKWICFVLAAVMLLATAPVAMAQEKLVINENSIVTIVNCENSVNVRDRATSNSLSLGEAQKGEIFQLLAVEGNWYKIQFTKDQTGYVFHYYAKLGSMTDFTGIGTVVNAPDGVNIREKASSKSEILGVAQNGDVFDVRGRSGSWIRVLYNGGTAYIYKAYLKLSINPDPNAPVKPGEKGYINCNTHVNVRAKATSASKKLGELKRGAQVSVTGISGNWTRISYKGGVGYVFTKYVSRTKPDDVTGKTATIVNCKYCVNVRAKASSASKKLGTADKGSTWTVKGLSGNWVKIDFYGVNAYVYKRYVKIG